MKAKTKLTKLWSFLLSLVMLLSLLPTTAFAASYAKISVNDILLEDNYYLESNSATGSNYSNTEPSSYVAWYKNGVLTLNGYNGKRHCDARRRRRRAYRQADRNELHQ